MDDVFDLPMRQPLTIKPPLNITYLYPDKWEYKVEVLYPDYQAELNTLGEDGWELVTLTLAGETYHPVAYFKRPIYPKMVSTNG